MVNILKMLVLTPNFAASADETVGLWELSGSGARGVLSSQQVSKPYILNPAP